jgi:hypothetical protein
MKVSLLDPNPPNYLALLDLGRGAMWASLATWGWGTWRLSGHFYGYVVDMLWIFYG